MCKPIKISKAADLLPLTIGAIGIVLPLLLTAPFWLASFFLPCQKLAAAS